MNLFSKQKSGPEEERPLSEEVIGAAVRAALEEEKQTGADAQAVEPPQADFPPAEAPRTVQKTGKTPLTHRTGLKVLAFIMVIVMAALTVGSAVAAIIMVEEELYTTSEWQYRHSSFHNLAMTDAKALRDLLRDEAGGEQRVIRYLDERNIAEAEVRFSDGSRRGWGYSKGGTTPSAEYSFTYKWFIVQADDQTIYYFGDYSAEDRARDNPDSVVSADITIHLADRFTEKDIYYFADRLISVIYALRYWIYAIGIAALVSAILWFAFLMCASGRRKGYPDPQPGWGTKVPFDLLTAGVLFAVFLLVEFAVESVYFHSIWKQAATMAAAGIAIAVIVLGWCMSAALRFKLGGWWKNTLCFYALRLSWRLLKKLWRGFRVIGAAVLRGFRVLGNSLLTLFRGIPFVRQAIYLYLCFVIVEGLLLLLSCVVFYWDGMIVVWTLLRSAILPVVILYALMLRKLQKGGEALAAGDLSYQVDTVRMPWSYKEHGENLNRIAEGMTVAVEQRLKSERMKTELITNVSHDIKTPLTSIINYSDLIEKEPCENEKITEYAGVLHRQSERLKRLIDDLVEASKASTGNLEVLLAPCEVGVMLTQTAGEYEQRLAEKELSLVTSQPEHPVKILADGRRLWRVFDNLMSNIYKYAQRGTRVYLTLEEQDGQAVISFKNISREPLNLSPDELLERFVQGDAARKTEGNGLGLSIAKSLTELQKGSLELMTDGDLFKVVLKFPTIQ